MNKPVEVVTVVPYREEFRSAFEQLNRDWIEQYFVLEEPDLEVFRDPGTKILQPGGEIFFVLEGDQVQGTCAVLRHDRENCEIAIRFATDTGARRIIIVSNTVLAPAIRLYEKHGFVRVPMALDSRYRRANIRMERELGPTEPAWHPEANE